MRFRSLFTITLLFSVLFCIVALVLAHEFIIGAISPRGLGVGLAALCIVGAVAVALGLKSKSVRKSILVEPPRDAGLTSWNGKVFAIWVGKIAVVLLVLAFVNGLWHIRQKPLAPRLVGLGANLLITFAVVSAVRKLQSGAK